MEKASPHLVFVPNAEGCDTLNATGDPTSRREMETLSACAAYLFLTLEMTSSANPIYRNVNRSPLTVKLSPMARMKGLA